jgi:hypothetical protein
MRLVHLESDIVVTDLAGGRRECLPVRSAGPDLQAPVSIDARARPSREATDLCSGAGIASIEPSADYLR